MHVYTEAVPQKVNEQIFAQQHFDEVKKSSEVGQPLVMDFGDSGQVIVLVFQERRLNLSRSCAVYAVDISPISEVMGFGVSLLPLDENNHFKGEQPQVQFTLTKDRFREQGLGTRRLLILNEVNKNLFHQYLKSGTFASHHPGVEKAWEKLVSRGFAVQEKDGGYKFIK